MFQPRTYDTICKYIIINAENYIYTEIKYLQQAYVKNNLQSWIL